MENQFDLMATTMSLACIYVLVIHVCNFTSHRFDKYIFIVGLAIEVTGSTMLLVSHIGSTPFYQVIISAVVLMYMRVIALLALWQSTGQHTFPKVLEGKKDNPIDYVEWVLFSVIAIGALCVVITIMK